MNTREKAVLDKIVETLAGRLHPKKIILFGSRAKGTFAQGSDFDIALDTAGPGAQKKREISEAVENVSGLYGVDIVYLGETDEDFKKIILKTGKVIYEQ